MNTTIRLVSFAATVLALATSVAQAQMPPPHPPMHGGTTESVIVVGAPTSTVSAAAADTAELGAMTTSEEVAEVFAQDNGEAGTTGAAVVSAGQFDIEVGGGSSTVAGQDMDIYTVKVPYSKKLSERGTIQLSIPVSFTTYKDAVTTFDPTSGLAQFKDADAYGVGVNLGYAHQALMKSDSRNFRWKLTPSAGVFYRDCADLNLGSLVANMGLSSSFAWQFSPGWVVNFGNSLSLSWSDGIRNYPDPIRDNQQMLTNGIQIFRLLDRWTVYGYVLDTEALRDVLVDSYQTYALGFSYKITKTRSFRVTAIYEDGNSGYHSFRVTMGSNWRF